MMRRTRIQEFATVITLLACCLVSQAALAGQADEFDLNSMSISCKKSTTDDAYIDLLKRYDFSAIYELSKEKGGTETEDEFYEALEDICIPENFVAPKSYVEFSFGVSKLSNRSGLTESESFRLTEAYLDRTLSLSGTFFEGLISLSDRERNDSQNGGTAQDQAISGSVFGRIAIAPEGKFNSISINKQYRPSHKGRGTRLIIGLNAAKSESSAYGFDIETGYRNTGSKLLFAYDVLGRARWWMYDDGDSEIVYNAAATAKYPHTPVGGWQIDLGLGYQDNEGIDTQTYGIGTGLEFHWLKPLVIRTELGRIINFGDAFDQEEYETRMALSVILKIPALKYIESKSVPIAGIDYEWYFPIWSVAGSGTGGRVFTIDELRP